MFFFVYIFLLICHKTWCDQAKSAWSRSNSVFIFIFLTNCMHHCDSYILRKTPLKLVNWFQRYEQFKNVKNNTKQKTFSALFGSILKSIFPTSDWFCLITSQMMWTLNTSLNRFLVKFLSKNRYLYILYFISFQIMKKKSNQNLPNCAQYHPKKVCQWTYKIMIHVWITIHL